MTTATEKFLNYNGLVKLISLIKANFNKATIAEKNTTATADTNDKYIKVTRFGDAYTVTTTGIDTAISTGTSFKTNSFVKSIAGYGTGSAPSSTNGVNDTKNKLEGTYTTGKLDGTGTDVTTNKFTYIDTTYGTASTTKAGLMSASDYSKLADLTASTINATIHAGKDDEDTTTIQSYFEWLEDKVGSVNVFASASIASGTCTMTSSEMADIGLENIRLICNGWPAHIVDFDNSTQELTAYFIWRETTGSTMSNHYTAIYFKVDNSGNVTSLLTRRLLDTTDNSVTTIKNNADSSALTGDVVVKKINGNSLVVNTSDTITDITLNAGNLYLSSAINTNEYTTSDTIQTVLTSLNTKINNATSTCLTRTIVTLLPTTGISETTIYMILASNDTNGNDPSTSTSQNQNAYNEYMYINNAWERIGSTEVNLDIDVITNSEIDTAWSTTAASA